MEAASYVSDCDSFGLVAYDMYLLESFHGILDIYKYYMTSTYFESYVDEIETLAATEIEAY